MTTRTELIAWLRREVKDSTYPPTDEPEAMMLAAADMLEADALEIAEAETDFSEYAQVIENFQISEQKLRAAARLAMDELLGYQEQMESEWGVNRGRSHE
jgi:hypothetical protein